MKSQQTRAVRADPLHLVELFSLSAETGIAYAAVARRLLERPVEGAALPAWVPSLSTLDH